MGNPNGTVARRGILRPGTAGCGFFIWESHGNPEKNTKKGWS